MDDNSALGAYLKAVRDIPGGHLGQIHVVDDAGVVHNFVGPQTLPLTTARDGGPYLDEVEAFRMQQRREYALSAPSTVSIDDAPNSVSIVRDSDDPTVEPVDEFTVEPGKSVNAKSSK